jgi:DNA segregation ATPase FtsK/SpoIIIE, S-DNA-T family
MKRSKKDTGNGDELSLKNEIIAILLLFSALFLIFSLASFDPNDPSFLNLAPQKEVGNWGGRVGGEVAAFFFNLFGLAAYLLIPICLFYTAYFLLNRKITNIVTKSCGFALLMVSGSSSLALLLSGQPVTRSGGILGYFLGSLLCGEIKLLFSLLFFLSLLAVSLVMIAKISIRRLMLLLGSLLAKTAAVISNVVRQRAEEWRKRRNLKKIQEKYTVEPAPPPREREKPMTREKERENSREPDPPRERKPIVRQPSKLPEESLLFPEIDAPALSGDSYKPPPLTYLDAATEKSRIDHNELEEKKHELSQRLQEFRINGQISEYTPGPVITTFEFVPDIGVKIKDVSSLTEDLALAVKAQYVRIERILGKKAIGIEIPNKKRETIHLREVLESPAFRNYPSPLTLAVGKTTSGEIFVSDLREMPHLIIAGATGSGKSVAIHSIILSILYKSSPKTVKFILIDPKRIELAIYNTLPHLLTPVVVQPKLAKNALDWAVWEMEERYKKLATLQVRNIEQYNKKLELMIQSGDEELEGLEEREKIPYIVIIIDELADLMMASGREIEENIARLAQKARAVGIHLILATQRPSVDVITGTIKNNFPSRMALAVPTKTDSRTIIDQMGAEKLLGNGDMLFLPPKTASLIRLHCAFVSEAETVRVVNFLAKTGKPEFNTQIIRPGTKKDENGNGGDADDLFYDAAETVVTTGQASASYLQRKMSVGYARAGRLMDQLQDRGVVSPPNSRNQREILVTLEDLQKLRAADAEAGDDSEA